MQIFACCSRLHVADHLDKFFVPSISNPLRKVTSRLLSIDLSRFTQVDEVNCLPISWGRYRSKTKLLCRKCGVLIGYGYGDSSVLCGFDLPTSSNSSYKKIMIKIRALQPSEMCQQN
ncbi:hypothetical protein Acr_23g0017570 [Actinidia rufa]|uniref:Uncharacterized protein n=1 Tax=Actinidia rufa TaxID=165716 RepID=A0A7J0GRE2_9ERIC|nr:hypothetical protein Acr_23g0017570 [Actinidia rufa]